MSTSDSWREVGAKLESLGLKLKLHYQQEHVEPQTEQRDAMTRLADAVDDAFDALGNAASDDAVKADVRDAGQALSSALAATFADVNSSLRKAFASDEAEDEPPAVED